MTCVVAVVASLAGCMKETDEIILLPVQNGTIPETVLSLSEQDSVRQYMDINEGVTPPHVVGSYDVSPMTLLYSSDGYAGDFYDLRWMVERQNGRNIVTYSDLQGGAVGKSREAHIIGEGDKFTIYIVEEAVNELRGWQCEMVTVISGVYRDRNVAGYKCGIVMRNKVDENGMLIEPDSYRVFEDGDGVATNIMNGK